jgi:hypothetical protein
MNGPDVEGVLAAHRAIVSGDEDGWHVVCTCGHREPGDGTVAHVAAVLRAEVRAWLESEEAVSLVGGLLACRMSVRAALAALAECVGVEEVGA